MRVDERLVDEGRPEAEQLAGAAAPRSRPASPAGGADRVRGTISRPTSDAVRASAQRHAARSITSGGSAVAGGTVGPPSASTPHSSKHHSSTASSASWTRCAKIAAVAVAFSAASGHENPTRVSADQPAWWQSSAL